MAMKVLTTAMAGPSKHVLQIREGVSEAVDKIITLRAY